MLVSHWELNVGGIQTIQNELFAFSASKKQKLFKKKEQLHIMNPRRRSKLLPSSLTWLYRMQKFDSRQRSYSAGEYL